MAVTLSYEEFVKHYCVTKPTGRQEEYIRQFLLVEKYSLDSGRGSGKSWVRMAVMAYLIDAERPR